MEDKHKMEIATFDEWWQDEILRREWVIKNHPESLKGRDECIERKMSQRKGIQDKFPHVVCLAGYWPQHDVANRWLFLNVGPNDGKCVDHHSEYPACPLVLATEKLVDRSYLDHDGKMVEYIEKVYSDPGEHSHEGVWAGIFLGKTGYDYGLTEYCFKFTTDRDRFLAAVPSFDFGELY